MAMLKVVFPAGRMSIASNEKFTAFLKYNNNYSRIFNSNLNLIQKQTDNLVITYLQEYVSYKEGFQAASIRNSSVAGSGLVKIDVSYAEYQAYSKKIRKRVGKRGTQPFERMKSDKRDSILKQTLAYARRLNNG